MVSPYARMNVVAILLFISLATPSGLLADQTPATEGAASSTSFTQAFTDLRLAYAGRPGYAGTWVHEVDREAANKAYEDKRSTDFMRMSEAWLVKCPVDARIHLMRATQLSQDGDALAAGYHRLMFYGLLMSIISTGDGRSEDSAYRVISVDEEYTVLNYVGAKLKEQKLKGHYDVMTVDLDGKSTTLYFDITIPLKVMADQLNVGKKKP